MVIEGYDIQCELKFGSHDVNSLCFDSTGGILAVSTSDKKINLFDASAALLPGTSSEPLKHLPVSPLNSTGEHHTYSVACCTFCAHSPLLATCGIDGYLIVWDLLDITSPNVHCKFSAGQFKVCRFSPNSTLPLLSAGDAEGYVYIYDYAKKTLKHKLRGHQGQVTALTFTPDALWLMAGSSGMGTGDLWLWSVFQHSQLEEVSPVHAADVDSAAHEMGIYCVQFSPTFSSGDSGNSSGLLAVTGGGDNLVKLWTIRPYVKQNKRIECRAKLEYHTYTVTDCQFSPDGKFICSVSLDKNVAIWSSFSGDLLQVLSKHSRFINACSWSPLVSRVNPHCALIATGGNDKTVLIWRVNKGGGCGLPTELFNAQSAADQSNGSNGQSAHGVKEALLVDLSQSDYPNEFYCPISHDVMQDPVVAADGYSYERKALQKWLITSHTSPITNLPLPSIQLIPNRTLKSLIKAQTDNKTNSSASAAETNVNTHTS